jgi:hypothetical protein
MYNIQLYFKKTVNDFAFSQRTLTILFQASAYKYWECSR